MTNTSSSAQQQAHETAEKLNKILTQNQSSQAESKGQLREVSNQKEATKTNVQTDLLKNKIVRQALRLISLLKVHKVAKQTNQRYQILVM